MADGEAVVGSGNLSCSSQVSIIWSIVLIWTSATACICVRAVSTTCSGQPNALAASAIFSTTSLPLFSLASAVSLREST